MAEARGPNIVDMHVAGRFASMNSVSYWPPTTRDGSFNYTMKRYFPDGPDGTIQRCYGSGGQGQTCRDFQKAVMIPTHWIVLKDGTVKLPEPVLEVPAFQSGVMIRAAGLGQCLEVDLNTPVNGDGRRVVTAPCTGSPEQLWTMDAERTSPIQSQVSGLCLDVDDSSPMAEGPRAVQAWPCKAGIIIGISNQGWTIGQNGTLQVSSGFPIRTRALTTLLPALPPATEGSDPVRLPVIAVPPAGNLKPSQEWRFESPPPAQ
jgi:hypothetical protein